MLELRICVDLITVVIHENHERYSDTPQNVQRNEPGGFGGHIRWVDGVRQHRILSLQNRRKSVFLPLKMNLQSAVPACACDRTFRNTQQQVPASIKLLWAHALDQ